MDKANEGTVGRDRYPLPERAHSIEATLKDNSQLSPIDESASSDGQNVGGDPSSVELPNRRNSTLSQSLRLATVRLSKYLVWLPAAYYISAYHFNEADFDSFYLVFGTLFLMGAMIGSEVPANLLSRRIHWSFIALFLASLYSGWTEAIDYLTLKFVLREGGMNQVLLDYALSLFFGISTGILYRRSVTNVGGKAKLEKSRATENETDPTQSPVTPAWLPRVTSTLDIVKAILVPLVPVIAAVVAATFGKK